MNFLCLASGRDQSQAAMLAGLGAFAVIASALAFQHIGGFIPCLLCYVQREPYYIAMPALVIAFISARAGGPPCVTRGFLAIGALCFAGTAAMGVFHSGVEWGFWPGPAECGLGANPDISSAANLLDQLQSTKAPSCNEAAGRFLGLSFAGWNVIAAAVLMVIAGRGALRPNRG